MYGFNSIVIKRNSISQPTVLSFTTIKKTKISKSAHLEILSCRTFSQVQKVSRMCLYMLSRVLSFVMPKFLNGDERLYSHSFPWNSYLHAVTRAKLPKTGKLSKLSCSGLQNSRAMVCSLRLKCTYFSKEVEIPYLQSSW